MKFTTGEIISAGLGKLCCPMERVYNIMNFLTGDNLYTHQLPRAFHACEAWVKEQHPWLLKLDEAGCNPKTFKNWLAAAELAYGMEHELEPLPPGKWQPCDPVSELIQLTEDKSKVNCCEDMSKQFNQPTQKGSRNDG